MERKELAGLLVTKLKDFGVETEEMLNDDLMLVINSRDLLHVMTILKKDPDLRFIFFTNQLGVDCGESFGLIYNLYSFHLDRKLTVRTSVAKDSPEVDSIERLYRGAGWFERETYDLLGIRFRGHSNLSRLLLPEDWEGHPLRKDYVFPQAYQGIELNRPTLFESTGADNSNG